MAITVKKAVLWRRQLENQPGTLANSLKPFADARINLQVVMGYVYPGDRQKAALEVYPVANKKAEAAARAAGLAPAQGIHCLVVQGDDQVGLAYKIASALSESSINVSFAVFQVAAGKYHGVFGFATAGDATKASTLIAKAGKVARGKAVKKAGASKKVAKKSSSKTSSKAGKAKSKKTSAPKAAARRTGRKSPSSKPGKSRKSKSK